MNDSGSIYFGVGTPSPPQSGTGNKMLNNKVHDVNDASVMDSDGYGGDGLYADDFSGLVDMENNLVYRVSGNAISFSGPRAGPNQSSTVKNNILAFARQSLVNSYDPYSFNTVPPLPMFFAASNNLFYFDRKGADSFYVEGGCTYPGEAFTAYEQWTSNLYWRTDGAFATDLQAFHVQQSLDASGNCGNQKLWKYYTLPFGRAWARMRKASCRIPASTTLAIQPTTTRCLKDRPVWDSSCSIQTRPAVRIRSSSLLQFQPRFLRRPSTLRQIFSSECSVRNASGPVPEKLVWRGCRPLKQSSD